MMCVYNKVYYLLSQASEPKHLDPLLLCADKSGLKSLQALPEDRLRVCEPLTSGDESRTSDCLRAFVNSNLAGNVGEYPGWDGQL